MKHHRPGIILCNNLKDLSERAARAFRALAMESIRDKGAFNAALSGGSTPAGMYKLLASDDIAEGINWERVNLFWSDERCVPPSHPESNYAAAKRLLIDKIEIPAANVHRIKGELGGERAALEYERELRVFFKTGAGSFPAFDLVVLGMGADGHTASIFPGSPALKEAKKTAVSLYVEGLNSTRVTLTPPVIRGAGNIIFLVSGAEKAHTLFDVIEGAFTPERFPAQMTFLSSGEARWFVDEEAAALLTPSSPLRED